MTKKKKYTKDEIIQFAKGLYLQIGKDKKKKHTLQSVIDEIKAKFNKNLTRPTILNWSRKYEWDKLFVKSIQHNIKLAEKEAELEERDVLAEKGKDFRAFYKNHSILAKAAMGQLGLKLKDKELTTAELLKLSKDSSDMILKLNDIVDDDNGVTVNIIKNYG